MSKQNIYNILSDNIKNLSVNKFIVAVSGGVDSVVLLDLLSKTGNDLVVAHYNHGVRKDTDKDEQFVEELANKYGLNYESEKLESLFEGNLEEKLRIKRYEFLRRIAKKHSADYIVTAHNMNDQAETVILNLLRGAAASGLSAMKIEENDILRPLLNVSKDDIKTYATKNKLKWQEDVTNIDTSFNRNFVRHKIFPLFSDINSKFIENIYNSSVFFSEIDSYLKTNSENFLDKNIEIIRTLETPLRFELYGIMYEKVKGNRKNLTLSNFNEIDKLISSNEGTKEVSLPDNVIAKRTYSTLEFLVKKEDNIASNQVQPIELGKNSFFDWEITAEKTKKTEFSKDKFSLLIDQKMLPFLKIRTWQQGDYINKEGLTGKKKLQDVFIDAKINKDERQKWPIIQQEDRIIWIPGIAFARELETGTENIKITARKVVNEN